MSFHFAGAGTAADVIRQIRSHHLDGGFGHELRELVCSMLASPGDPGAEEYVYSVEVTGHAGGGAVSLDVKIRPVWAPATWRSIPVDELAGMTPEQAASIVRAEPGPALRDMVAAMPEQAMEFLQGLDAGTLGAHVAELARTNPAAFANLAQLAAGQLVDSLGAQAAAAVDHAGGYVLGDRCQHCGRLAGMPTAPCAWCPDVEAPIAAEAVNGHALGIGLDEDV